MADRREFIEELRTKKYVRESLEEQMKKQKEKEKKLRSVVRSLIQEATGRDVHYESTGVNILADKIKKIIPVIGDDYKSLTSSKRQRKSYRQHLINAVKQSLMPIQNYHKAAKEIAQKQKELDEEEEDRFIDVPEETDNKEANQPGGDEEAKVPKIPGADETGRNIALQTFSRIESDILDGYEVLANEQDREVYREYLLDNLQLYFERWESEIGEDALGEPDQDQEVPDEVLEEIDATRGNVRDQKQDQQKKKGKTGPGSETRWRGWKAFKEQTMKALNEDGYKRFMDHSEDELKQKLQDLRDEFQSAEGEELEKLEYDIGSAMGALWKKGIKQ